MAHRGGSLLAPENTLEAFRRALEWWRADVLEVDVQPTADGDVVVFHDATVDRTTDGSGPVAGLRLEEIRRLDGGFRFTADGGRSFPFRGRGVRIATLEELLRAFPDARVNVEIKDRRAQRRVWETVHDLRATGRVLIAAGHRANRSLFGDYPGPTSASGEEMKAFYLHHLTHTTRFWRPPVDAFQMPERYGGVQVLTPRFLREVQARNVAVHVWTVDEEADMRRLLRLGVDGIVTDRPDRLARVLHEMFGRPLPPGTPDEATEGPQLNREPPANG
ncbi:MAG TPA: glycerophosphodiester phosphodiesterase [Longimicrobiaceae bacterium]|nr:glycerophosphodiester phosphodiesterase [Longimicrobiaceae bacterium]